MTKEGVVIKGIGGFYYVRCDGIVYECKAKGKFRKHRISPVAGDNVTISINELAENTIDEIHERKNVLRRPPVANIDKLFIVVSTCEPNPNTIVIDRLTVLAEKNGIEPVIVLSKTDLKSADELYEIYSKTPYKVLYNTQLDNIKDEISGHLCAFTGNSGVGKSTLLNNLVPGLNLETNAISEKLGRGKHTTRQAEIFSVGDGWVIDTAGFSSVEFDMSEIILKEDLQHYFPEFEEYHLDCKFTGCAHVNDKGCEIVNHVNLGDISKSRHDSYVFLYNEAKDIKQWQL